VAAATREDAEGDYVTTQVYDYDDHGNVKKTRTYLVGFGNFELEYQYDLISGKVNRANYQKGKPDYFAHRYSYDADNRLVKAETTRDNVFWDRDGRYFYYPHGPLARLEVGEDNVQGQDHYYSIHGWIKGVNMPGAQDGSIDPGLDGEVASSANDDRWVGRDAMAYYLGFYATDYNPIGSVQQGVTNGIWGDLSQYILTLPGGQSAGLYNGNIPLMVTDLKKASIGNSFIGGAIANAYQYDQLNRLKDDKTYHRNNAGWARFASGTPGVTYGLWDNGYTYDRNGNIETLHRSVPDYSAGFSFRTLDNLTYNYSAANKVDNRLNSVVDLEPIPTIGDPGLVGSIYTYDAIGNLIADQNEKIANIEWDLHNKVRKVERTASSNDPELEFWYDGTGNRVHKRVTLASGAVKDEWYVRDPQGNEMAVYERVEENGFRVTRCKEHPIYGADRLGMDLNGVELSRYAVVAGDGDPKDPTGDPAGRHALVIAEIMYDSPTTGDDFPTGKEYNEGEYVVLVNKSGMNLDLADYKLHYGSDSMALHDTLPAGERVIVAFGENAGAFGRVVALPAGLEDAVFMQNTLVLRDRGGIVSVSHASGAEIDAMVYGDFYGLSAGNAYIADTLLDSMSRRSSLKSVQRASYGGASESEGSVGDIDPGLQTERSEQAEVGSFYLNRGRKVYELKNHLGNVLAVVSDVKFGVSTSSLVDYYVGDVVEMTDYEPFGMELANRHWVSGSGYRFGFNGKESDDAWNGEGNMYNYGFRIHDPRLGRFLSVDPLAPDYPELTTYQYASNSPVWMIDIDGLEGAPSASLQDFLGWYLQPLDVGFKEPQKILSHDPFLASVKWALPDGGLGRKLFDHYEKGRGEPYRLSNSEMAEIFPKKDWDNNPLKLRVPDYVFLKAQNCKAGESLCYEQHDIKGYANASGTLGRTLVQLTGDVHVLENNTRIFYGIIRFDDLIDFGPSDSRGVIAEILTQSADFLLKGDSFYLHGELKVYQLQGQDMKFVDPDAVSGASKNYLKLAVGADMATDGAAVAFPIGGVVEAQRVEKILHEY
jgi:RHS repeat-associated protein